MTYSPSFGRRGGRSVRLRSGALRKIAAKRSFHSSRRRSGTANSRQSKPRIIDRGRTIPLDELRRVETSVLLRDAGSLRGSQPFSLDAAKVALGRAVQGRASIFTGGSFRKNEDYKRLLAALFPLRLRSFPAWRKPRFLGLPCSRRRRRTTDVRVSSAEFRSWTPEGRPLPKPEMSHILTFLVRL